MQSFSPSLSLTPLQMVMPHCPLSLTAPLSLSVPPQRRWSSGGGTAGSGTTTLSYGAAPSGVRIQLPHTASSEARGSVRICRHGGMARGGEEWRRWATRLDGIHGPMDGLCGPNPSRVLIFLFSFLINGSGYKTTSENISLGLAQRWMPKLPPKLFFVVVVIMHSNETQ